MASRVTSTEPHHHSKASSSSFARSPSLDPRWPLQSSKPSGNEGLANKPLPPRRISSSEHRAGQEAAQPEAPVLMEGTLKKKGARVNMWTSRYCLLRGKKLLMYKKKEDAGHHLPPRREFMLVPGCYVSDITELSYQKKPLFEFRLVWPDHVTNYGIPTKVSRFYTRSRGNEAPMGAGVGPPTDNDSDADEEGGGDSLARLAEETAKTAKQQKNRAAAAQELSEVQSNSTSSLVGKGATVAGVALGGVVVGFLTAGVGVPVYLGVVGAVVAAGGGAVALSASQAGPSRLILAAETEVRMNE